MPCWRRKILGPVVRGRIGDLALKDERLQPMQEKQVQFDKSSRTSRCIG